MKTKKELRHEILKIRDSIPSEIRQKKSEQIAQQLYSTVQYKEARRVLCYISYQSEVDTRDICRQCWQDGKEVYAPVVCGDEMRFFRIDSLEELKEGYKGILEPEADPQREWRGNDKADLLLMPGVAFDGNCNRIGYGKGFYDRFLAKCGKQYDAVYKSNGDVSQTVFAKQVEEAFYRNKIALAFSEQVVPAETFETEATDLRPDFIITE